MASGFNRAIRQGTRMPYRKFYKNQSVFFDIDGVAYSGRITKVSNKKRKDGDLYEYRYTVVNKKHKIIYSGPHSEIVGANIYKYLVDHAAKFLKKDPTDLWNRVNGTGWSIKKLREIIENEGLCPKCVDGRRKDFGHQGRHTSLKRRAADSRLPPNKRQRRLKF